MFRKVKPRTVLYRQTHFGVRNAVTHLNDITWFSPIANYGDSYGPIVSTYTPKRALKVLNLGSMKTRKHLVSLFPRLSTLLDPDEQYSGGKANTRIHKLLQKYFGNQCDGTIIIDNDLKDEDRDMLEGPSEIVLWGNLAHKIKKL